MAVYQPRDNPWHWPVDVFDERAAYARDREMILLKLDEKRMKVGDATVSGEARMRAMKCKRLGIGPLFPAVRHG
jgi:hypothetical protein